MSFSANQRGCSIKIREVLLKQLTTNVKCPFYGRDTDFPSEFGKVHDLVMQSFVSELKSFCDEWLQSPAGKAHVGDCEKKRYSVIQGLLIFVIRKGKAKYHYLTTGDLGGLVIQGDEYDGIELSGVYISRFAGPFLAITETAMTATPGSVGIHLLRCSLSSLLG